MSLTITPVTICEANEYVRRYHRHHGPVVGAKFALAISDESGIRGIALVGRPVARHYDDGFTLEVNRCCTDGVKNGCSMLYGAAWRVARAMGYRRIITYSLVKEGGTSLRAAGWKVLAVRSGGWNWNMPSRPRVEKPSMGRKFLWEMSTCP